MKFERELELLLVHCQGEIGKVLVSGAPTTPGATAEEQMAHINEVDDRLRRMVTSEPRASAAMSVNLLIEPTRPDADAGFIVLQADRAHAMSGSNCICVVTALLESGRIAIVEPQTVVRLDTPAGLIIARAHCEQGRCLSVSLDNVPCFVEQLDYTFETERWGPLQADIAFGGVFYAIVDVAQIGLTIEPKNARALAEAGVQLHDILSRQMPVRHPQNPSVEGISYVMFRDQDPDGVIRTCTTLKPGRVDRSPCGTGSSANLAVLHARGQVRVGDTRRSRSISGGEFELLVCGETTMAGRPAIVPRVTGGAWIYGREFLRLDDRDPFPVGFMLSDMWGDLQAQDR